MFWHEHMNTGGWVFMVLGNIVIWSVTFAFIFWLVQDWRTRGQHRAMRSESSAREILDRRLAAGEIDTDEYRHLRETLGDAPPARPPAVGQAPANT